MVTTPKYEDIILPLARTASRTGNAYIVGGTVRDIILGRQVTDIDLAVSCEAGAAAADIARATGGTCFVMDKARDVYRVAGPGVGLQVDISPLKGSIENDLSARDFTINAMAVSMSGVRGQGLEHLTPIDPYGGMDDLKAGVIRVLGRDALTDDPLRMLRAFRLSAQLGFTIEPETLSLIEENSILIEDVSAERVRDELYAILGCAGSAAVFRAMHESGILDHIIPETVPMAGLVQGEPHVHDLLEHSLKSMDYAEDVMDNLPEWFGEHADAVGKYLDGRPDGGVNMRGVTKLGAFLHDVGKPCMMKHDGDRVRFIGHDSAGAEINAGIAERLRMSARARNVLSQTASLHMRPLHLTKDEHTMRAVFRLARDAGELLPALLIVALADARATRDRPDAVPTDVEGLVIETARYYYGEYLKANIEPLVTGHDLSGLGILPGPVYMRILGDVEECRAAGQLTTREDALEHIKSNLDWYYSAGSSEA